MNEVDRYNAEFEQIMRDAKADADRVENRDREAILKGLEKSFNRLADVHNWSAEQRAAKKKYWLDDFWD